MQFLNKSISCHQCQCFAHLQSVESNYSQFCFKIFKTCVRFSNSHALSVFFSAIIFPKDDCGCVAGARLAGASVYRSPPPTKVGVAHAWCLFAQISKVLWIFFATRFEYILILGEVNDLSYVLRY